MTSIQPPNHFYVQNELNNLDFCECGVAKRLHEMTPDKRVEDNIQKVLNRIATIPQRDFNGMAYVPSDELVYEMKESLHVALTKYHQDLMSEVVWNMRAAIEEADFASKVMERTGDATAVYEVQEVVRQIQTIIRLSK